MTTEAEKAFKAVNTRIASLQDEIRMVQESGCGGGDEYKADLVLFQEIRAALSSPQWEDIIKDEIKLLKLELEVINQRAEGVWLDKMPIIRAYLSRIKRLEKSLPPATKGIEG